jgi:hypothetical protein
MMMKVISNINKVEEEYMKVCEESTKIWMDLVEYPEMKAMEAKLREA